MKNKQFHKAYRLKVLIALLMITAGICLPAIGQVSQTMVFEQWNKQEGTQNMFIKSKTVTDGSGNVYVAGATVNSSGNYDILVAKYNSFGTQLWVNQYAGAAGDDDYGTAITLDGSNNVLVTGTLVNNISDSNDVVTIKYNNSGAQQWVATYSGGSGNDVGSSVTTDGSGNVYVAGASYRGTSTYYDALLLKYNASGTQQYVKFYNYNNKQDGAYRVTFKNGKVGIACGAQNSTTDYRYAAVRYDAATGILFSSNVSSPYGIGFKIISDAVVDNNWNIYITGSAVNMSLNTDCYTVKFDSSLVQQWTATYNGTNNLHDESQGIALDANGDVLITGFTTTSTQGKNFLTIKYASTNGAQSWIQTYNGATNGDDEGREVVTDGNNRIYVTGYSSNGTSKDYHTMKYDGSGNLKWQIAFNSVYNKDDVAYDIVSPATGQVIITGQNNRTSNEYSYTTVKYVEKDVVNVADTAQTNINYLFVENRGQLINTNQQAIPHVRYYNATTAYPHTFFTDTTMSMVFERADTLAATSDTAHRIDIKHLNQRDGRIYSFEQQAPYQNFFYPHASVSRCLEFQRLYQPEIYAGIDLEYASNMNGLKTYYILKPGTPSPSVSSIRMKFNGADSVAVLPSGDLAVYHALGVYVYAKPAAWQLTSAGAFVSLGWQPSFVEVAPNEVKFTNIGAYNTNEHLIIAMDQGYAPTPSMVLYNNVWSTYVHGVYTCEGGIGVCTDAQGRSYFTGTTQSFNFPTFNSPYIGNFVGLQDAYLMRFNTNNSQDYATFIGGSHVDVGQDVQIDPFGNIVVEGYTRSGDFPSQATGQQYTQLNVQGDISMFIIKLSNSGQINMWSTPFGGDDWEYTDFGRHLAIDPSGGAIYIAGVTQSDNSENFPLLNHVNGNPNAYNQATFGGGLSDGFIAKFSNTGVQLWTTYYGGVGEEYITSVNWDNGFNNLYVSGHTNTSNGYVSSGVPPTGDFPLTVSNGGFNQLVYGGGGYDAFIAKFDNAAEIKWSTYYGGAGDEYFHNIMAVRPDLYTLVGATTSSTGSSATCTAPNPGEMPSCNPGGVSTFNANNAGGTDIYIAQFDGSEVLKYATFYGGAGDEFPNKPNYDNMGNVYLSGYTYGGGFPTIDPGNNFFKQVNNADASGVTGDGLVLKLSNQQQITWATHYGGFMWGTPNCNNNHEWFMEVAPFSNTKLFGTGIALSLDGPPVAWPYRCGAPQYCFSTPTNGDWLQDIFVCEFDLTGGVGFSEPVAPAMFEFSVYPNPANDQLIIKQGQEYQKQVSIRIYNALGELVYAKNLDDFHAFATFTIDVSHFANGMYVVNLESNGVFASKKFIKQN